MLRALRFMDSMIQRDTMQKAAFLNDLSTFWDRFDDRVLRLKVTRFGGRQRAACLSLCLQCGLPAAMIALDAPQSI